MAETPPEGGPAAAPEPAPEPACPPDIPSLWRAEIAIRLRGLRARADALRAVSPDADLGPIERAIADAECAIVSTPPLKRAISWWHGTAITIAWDSAHSAEARLIELEDEETVRSVLPRLVRWIRQVMEEDDQRDRYEVELGAYIDGEPIDRTVIRQAMRDVIRANREKYTNVLSFRNGLWLVTLAMAALLVALAVWHAIDPSGFLTLCGDPVGRAGEAAGDPRCLTGTEPASADVASVLLLGAIGGLLMTAFGLGGAKAPPSRYDPRRAQAALKAVAGAATGLIGVLLVQSQLVVAPAGASESLLLAYAALFGFSQQLLTRFVDRRAGRLLESEQEHPPQEAAPHGPG